MESILIRTFKNQKRQRLSRALCCGYFIHSFFFIPWYRCPDTDSDSRTAHSCQKSSLQKFEFAVFRFKVSDVVFVHCDVVVCLAGVQNSSCFDKCAACDDKSGRKRRSIEDENYDKGSMPHHLRIGPWQIEEEGKGFQFFFINIRNICFWITGYISFFWDQWASKISPSLTPS